MACHMQWTDGNAVAYYLPHQSGEGIRCVSMSEGHGAIYTQIGSPSVFLWTPVHPGISVHATLDRQPGQLEGLPPLEQCGIRLSTCPQGGVAHRVALVKSARLAPQRMSR